MVTNLNNDLVPIMAFIGYGKCVDFRKLNKYIKKEQDPLPFINEILERLAKNSCFCYLDGYSCKCIKCPLSGFGVLKTSRLRD